MQGERGLKMSSRLCFTLRDVSFITVNNYTCFLATNFNTIKGKGGKKEEDARARDARRRDLVKFEHGPAHCAFSPLSPPNPPQHSPSTHFSPSHTSNTCTGVGVCLGAPPVRPFAASLHPSPSCSSTRSTSCWPKPCGAPPPTTAATATRPRPSRPPRRHPRRR